MDHTSTYRGTVKGLHEDYDDKDKVRLEIEPTNYPKPKRKKGEAVPFTPTRSECVSKAMAGGLAIGDQVECTTTVRKVRRAKRKGN